MKMCTKMPRFLSSIALRGPLARLARPLCVRSHPSPAALIPAEQMPHALRRRIAGIEALHAEFEELEEAHHEQLRLIEQSFTEKSNALFTRRQRIVAGVEEPTDEEVARSAYFAEFEEVLGKAPESRPGDAPVVGIPAFWPTVLRRCTSLQPDAIEGFAISEADWAVLEHLVEVRMEPWQPQEQMPDDFDADVVHDEPGFSFTFVFAPNPLLRSPELTIFCLGSMEVASATTPQWTDPKHDPTVTWRTKKVRKKGAAETIKKLSARPVESFFRIFAVESVAGDETLADEEDERMSLQELQQDIVFRLRDDVVPRASMYYISQLHGFDDEDLDDEGEELEREDWERSRREGKGQR
jgi:nucleosome assembly protein 1-like 1